MARCFDHCRRYGLGKCRRRFGIAMVAPAGLRRNDGPRGALSIVRPRLASRCQGGLTGGVGTHG